MIAAQAKGLPNRRVVFTYAARNAILPQLQGFGLAIGFVVSGALIMEIVFSYPGIGLLLLSAVSSNDYPLMQAIFLVITFAVLIANLIVDLDHRVRRSPRPGTGGDAMTVTLPISADPAALAAEEAARPAAGAGCRPRRRWAPSFSASSSSRPSSGPWSRPTIRRTRIPRPALSLQAPSAAHLLGTTQSGQDVLSQLLVGIRLTLELAFIVGVVATALAVIVGVSAAFLGGVWDELLSLVTNVFLVIPALPLLIILLGYLPQKGQLATIAVLACSAGRGVPGDPGADPGHPQPRLRGRVTILPAPTHSRTS